MRRACKRDPLPRSPASSPDSPASPESSPDSSYRHPMRLALTTRMLTVRVIEEFLQVCWNQLGASQAAGRAWREGEGAWRGGGEGGGEVEAGSEKR